MGILNKTSLQLTDCSILKTVDSLNMFLEHYYSEDAFNDVSLLLLIRMLKDLGKVCGFKRYAIWNDDIQNEPDDEDAFDRIMRQKNDLILQTLSQSSQYLEYAAIICQNLVGQKHS